MALKSRGETGHGRRHRRVIVSKHSTGRRQNLLDIDMHARCRLRIDRGQHVLQKIANRLGASGLNLSFVLRLPGELGLLAGVQPTAGGQDRPQ